MPGFAWTVLLLDLCQGLILYLRGCIELVALVRVTMLFFVMQRVGGIFWKYIP